MDILKKVFFPLFSVFLVFRSYELMKQVLSNQASSYTVIEVCFIAFLLTLFITGIFALTGFAYPTNRILPDSYYKIKKPDLLMKIATWMGVPYFKYLLLISFWGKPKNRKKYFNGTKQGLENFMYQTKQSEFGHVAPFVIILILCGILAFHGHILITAISMLINMIGNLYPVILQRTHRIQIQRILN